ncbi:DUF2147 domain-containing protein [Spirosoma panaciterrae]|jgi:uncharacterized protein (DUF2147 family)|uniref:DUF2147 domain-containing protein n=1 Tax=Spirosoma panaciterrae TaxID=496058 RepID=UPI000371EBF8|nr:DUF2147 domain-containing protein [Spirosoma panaciterrae]
MKKQLIILFWLAGIGCGYAQTDITKGTWFNQEKESRIQFAKQSEQLTGKLVWLKDRDVLDTKNPDVSLQKRPLLGTTVLTGFKVDGTNQWTDGKVYDPKSGKTYSAKMTLKNPTTLELRGYVGSPMFGRTTVFTKAD